MNTPGDDTPVATLATELGRLADRLRSLSDVRLLQPFPPAGTRASAALDLAQRLADAGGGVQAREAAEPPPRRVVPDVGVFALGDQVAVTGADLVTAATPLVLDVPVWSEGAARRLGDVLQELTEAVRALRREL